jgi:hypothetical protein
MVWTDSDAALADGTTWSYFSTANFAAYTPFTASGYSNPTGPVTIHNSAAGTVGFKIQLDFDNPQCTSGNNCSANVYRATCTSATVCPVYNNSPGAFAKLSLTTTQTVTASNTHFVSLDAGAAPSPLAYNQNYAYAVTNSFLAYPSSSSSATQITVLTPTGAHQAVLNYSNASCRTSSPCNLQVYRVMCASSSSCPAYTPGDSAWKALNMAAGLVPTVGTQGTSWQYTDQDAALAGSTSYAWVATCSYVGASTASPASTPWIGTTGAGIIKVHVPSKESK